MMRGDEAIGLLSVVRGTPGPFTDKQFALVRTFADQAVIAIENARLLDELRSGRRIERGAGAADRDIGGAPRHHQFAGRVEPVFETMLANARRLCEAKFGVLYLLRRRPSDCGVTVTARSIRRARRATRI